jgi:hypothetical protein
MCILYIKYPIIFGAKVFFFRKRAYCFIYIKKINERYFIIRLIHFLFIICSMDGGKKHRKDFTWISALSWPWIFPQPVLQYVFKTFDFAPGFSIVLWIVDPKRFFFFFFYEGTKVSFFKNVYLKSHYRIWKYW